MPTNPTTDVATVPPKITLNNRQLHELVQPVLPMAQAVDTWGAQHLSSVLLQRAGNCLVASATNRYQLGVKRVRVDDMPNGAFGAVVSLSEITKLLSLFKPTRKSFVKQPKLTLEVAEGNLVAEAVPGVGMEKHDLAEVRIGCRLIDEKYPDLFKLVLEKMVQQVAPVSVIALDAELLANLSNAIKYGSPFGHRQIVFRIGEKPNSAIVVQIGEDFIGMVMPQSYEWADRTPRHDEVLPDWKATLGSLRELLPAPRALAP